MLDHVFTDAIGALRDALEKALLERQAFEERFQADVLLGDLTWETSLLAPRRGAAAPGALRHHPRLAHLVADRLPVLVHRGGAGRAAPHRDRGGAAHPAAGRAGRAGSGCSTALPLESAGDRPRDAAPIGPDARGDLRRATSTRSSTPSRCPTRASTSSTKATLADGSVLDEHFSAMGGWISSTLVRLGDLKMTFLPAPRGRRRQLTERGPVRCHRHSTSTGRPMLGPSEDAP